MSPNHKEEEILTKFEIVKNTTNHQSLEESSNSHNSQYKNEKHNQIEQCSKTPSSTSSSSSEEEKLEKKDKEEVEEEEDEDGFRTPTTLDHKISVLTCPPPPKKIKQSLKRRAASSYNNQYYSCRQLPLDLSKEVELLFPTYHIQLSDHSHRAKKFRRDDQEQK